MSLVLQKESCPGDIQGISQFFHNLPAFYLVCRGWSKSTSLVLLPRLFSAEHSDLTEFPAFRELNDLFRISF